MLTAVNTNERETDVVTILTNKIKVLEGLNQMVVHNMRGATANIKMLAEILISKKLQEPLQPEDDVFTAGEAIKYIYESSASLFNTLSTLLEVADIQLNKNAECAECDIARIIDHITWQLHGFVHQKKAVIELDLAVTLIRYPEAYMESILYNFINNSLKYSRQDVPLKISISTYAQNGRNVLVVKDNGLGIDLEAYGKSMFKLNQVFHSGYESKGIGLYITKTQVESLGGSISVRSTVNEGSEFTVIF